MAYLPVRRNKLNNLLRRASLATILACLIGILLWPSPTKGMPGIQFALPDALHVPFFLLLVVVLYGILARGRIRTQALPLAAILGLMVAIVSELLQPGFGRSRSNSDFLYNLSGLVTGVSAIAAFTGARNARRLSACGAGLVVAALLALVPAAHSRRVQTVIEEKFPVFGDFENELEEAAWSASSGTRIERSAEFASMGRQSLRIRSPAGDYAGVRFAGGTRDWGGYRVLAFEIHNPGDEFLLGIRIDDDGGGGAEPRRYAAEARVKAGSNRFRLELESHRDAVNFRRIARVVFYTGIGEPGREYFLDGVRLAEATEFRD